METMDDPTNIGPPDGGGGNSTDLGPPPLRLYVLYIAIIYLSIVVIFGLLGNILLVYASFKYTTFGSDRVAVILIRYLGIADILQIVLLVVPAIILFVYRWVFGKWGCYAFVYIEKFLNTAHFDVVLVITYHRMFRCICPRIAGKWSYKHAHLAIACTTCIALLQVPLTTIMMFDKDALVEYNEVTVERVGCHFWNMQGVVVMIQQFLDPILPFFLCITGNLTLWVFAIFKSRYKINLRPVITVTIITILISISWLPPIIMFRFNDTYRPHVLIEDDIPFLLREVSVLGIPIVFTIFNKPFAEFTKKAIVRVYNSCQGVFPESYSSSS